MPARPDCCPKSRGGSNSEGNLVTTTMPYVLARSESTVEEMGWKLDPRRLCGRMGRDVIVVRRIPEGESRAPQHQFLQHVVYRGQQGSAVCSTQSSPPALSPGALFRASISVFLELGVDACGQVGVLRHQVATTVEDLPILQHHISVHDHPYRPDEQVSLPLQFLGPDRLDPPFPGLVLRLQLIQRERVIGYRLALGPVRWCTGERWSRSARRHCPPPHR